MKQNRFLFPFYNVFHSIFNSLNRLLSINCVCFAKHITDAIDRNRVQVESLDKKKVK